MKNVAVSALSSAVNALIVSLMFFVWNDYLSKPPDLNGRWHFTGTITDSAARKYHGLKITYEVTLLQNGDQVKGFGEKIQEDLNGAVQTYAGKDRSPIEIEGSIHRNYLSPDTLSLIYKETGALRVSSTGLSLVRDSDTRMHGTFDSTIAASHGTVAWAR